MLLIAQSFNYLQAILGGKVEVPTLSGKMQVKVRQDLLYQFFLLLYRSLSEWKLPCPISRLET